MSYEIILALLRAQYPGKFVLYCRDLAEILDRSEGSISHLLDRGSLPFRVKRVGRERCVDIVQVAQWLADRGEESPPPIKPDRRERPVGAGLDNTPAQSAPLTSMMAGILQQRHDASIALVRRASQLDNLDERCFMVEVAQQLMFSKAALVSRFVVTLQRQKIVDGGLMRTDEKFFFDSDDAANYCLHTLKNGNYGEHSVRITMKQGRKLLHHFSYLDGAWWDLGVS